MLKPVLQRMMKREGRRLKEIAVLLEASVISRQIGEILLMTEITLTAVYQEAEEGGYIGYIAELPGANTQGETMEEVRENLLEAMQMILEANREEADRRLSKDA